MKITSPWRRFALPLCLAAATWQPLVAAEPLAVPVPVPSAEPIAAEAAVPDGEPTPAVPTPAGPAPLQAVELAPPLAAPPGSSSRLSRVKITDEASAPEAAVEAATPEEMNTEIVTEIVKERFANGAVKVEREVVQDREGNFVAHGVYRQFDERGALICEGKYEQGQAVGIWTRYYATNQAPLFATTPYKDFPGPYTSKVNFAEGQMEGKWLISDAKQRKISEIDFVAGQRHGKAAWFYANGTLLSQATYDRGRVHGDVMKWGPDASLLGKESYTHGRKLAPKVEYYDAEHKRSEILYLHAPMVVKTPDNFHAATLATFEQRGQDEKYGPFRVWHNNGQIARQGEFRYNLPVGKATWFYANGQKQMEGEYVDGKQEGPWTWWHQNGIKQITGEYRDGVAIGKWQWWKEDGKLAQKSNLSGAKVANIPAPQPDAEESSIRR